YPQKDFHLEIEESISDENVVWARMTLTTSGTYIDQEQEPKLLFAEPFAIPVVMIARFRDGQIYESWVEINYSYILLDRVPVLEGTQSDGWNPVIPQQNLEQNTPTTSLQNLEVARRVIFEVWNDPTVDTDTMRELY